MATTQTVGQLIAGGLIRRFKRDDGAWLVSFAAPTGPRIYNSLYRHPDSTADPEEESLIVLQNARKSVEWAIDHFLASRSDECPMCGKKAIELTEQARIAELERALQEYGNHKPTCQWNRMVGPCSCGWEAARKVLEGK